MSQIKVEFISLMVDITGLNEITLSIENEITLKDLISKLDDNIGREFTEMIVDKSGKIFNNVIIVINGERVHSSNLIDITLKGGDTISFIPAIAGG
ncbi:MAG: MoaD/ThiS family protein [Promethearchaeota archaeon]